MSQNLKPEVLVPDTRHLPEQEGRVIPEAATSLHSCFSPHIFKTLMEWQKGEAWGNQTRIAGPDGDSGASSQDPEGEVLFQESPGLGTSRTWSPFARAGQWTAQFQWELAPPV